MSDVLGDVSELHKRTIVATATHRVTGSSGSFHFRLSGASGIGKYFDSHASVAITGPVTVHISGPASATVSATADVAVVPDKYDSWPTEQQQVVQLQGSVSVQHSLLVPPSTTAVQFGNETATLLKPRTLVDYPPVVVGWYEIAGGTASSTAIIVVRVPLTVDGVAHHCTWE